ncbi:carboxymuconolactone decarboxylase family protein [Rhodovulum sp. DZ06]|uniref:carboxymuconolactone decarboxylase family protein n=1 Tax=Rhodovulum sp. DZ06 TaxID=3425126 RepID=UPI003D354117
MTALPALETADAPEAARPTLAKVAAAYGAVPNLMKAMSNSPQALDAYLAISGLVDAAAFSAAEKQVVQQAVNLEHGCAYCLAAHSAMGKMGGVDGALDAALRGGAPLADAKLDALRAFTLSVVRGRGHVPAGATEAFFAAGYDARALMDVLLIVTQKVMSNYTQHIAQAPLDAVFAPFAMEAA